MSKANDKKRTTTTSTANYVKNHSNNTKIRMNARALIHMNVHTLSPFLRLFRSAHTMWNEAWSNRCCELVTSWWSSQADGPNNARSSGAYKRDVFVHVTEETIPKCEIEEEGRKNKQRESILNCLKNWKKNIILKNKKWAKFE